MTLARILRPWGRRGEVAAEILTDFPERLAQVGEVWLADGRNAPRRAVIISSRVHLGQAVIHFEGVDSISDAERLRGCQVQIPMEERPSAAEGRHYIDDLVGCEVWERAPQSDAFVLLGTVAEVQGVGDPSHARMPEFWVIAVDTPQGEVLIPLAAEICTRIDIERRRIEVQLPEGLRDLNLRR